MSNNISFTIRKVFAGSEAQKNVGIYASFNMTIDGPDGIIASLNDMKLRKSREGKYYIESSYRTFDGKDKDESGKPKQGKVMACKLWPEQKNWAKQDLIIEQILRELEKNPSKPNSSRAPAATAAPTASESNDAPW